MPSYIGRMNRLGDSHRQVFSSRRCSFWRSTLGSTSCK